MLQKDSSYLIEGEASDAKTALLEFHRRSPDLVITELVLPDSSASHLISRARPLIAQCRFIVLTSDDGSKHVLHLLKAGASGFVLKSSPFAELHAALLSVVNGGIYVDAQINKTLFEQNVRARGKRVLLEDHEPTPRELEIMRLAAAGHGNKEIAAMLRLSVKTIETHKFRAMKKLGLRGRSDLVSYVVQRGWLPAGNTL